MEIIQIRTLVIPQWELIKNKRSDPNNQQSRKQFQQFPGLYPDNDIKILYLINKLPNNNLALLEIRSLVWSMLLITFRKDGYLYSCSRNWVSPDRFSFQAFVERFRVFRYCSSVITLISNDFV